MGMSVILCDPALTCFPIEGREGPSCLGTFCLSMSGCLSVCLSMSACSLVVSTPLIMVHSYNVNWILTCYVVVNCAVV